MNAEHAESVLLPLDEQMAELSLLIPRTQANALEAAAQSEGMSIGQYIRRALQQALNQFVLPGRFPCAG
ncbi:MAG: hypothetical protein U0793_26875 [Gemmataceae bacterium]